MDKASFIAKTDLQIGDKVRTYFEDSHEFTVYDIRTIHELRTKKVYFEFQLIDKQGTLTKWLPRKAVYLPRD